MIFRRFSAYAQSANPSSSPSNTTRSSASVSSGGACLPA
nr:MAG TPA: hypothetical protein [Caudoviricetes sp.]